MIYSASLNIIVKKCFGKQAQQSNLKKICDNMLIDPETSTMDVVIFGPRDAASTIKAEEINKAIKKKHPGVCVIYLYEKDADSDLIEADYTKQLRKIKEVGVKDAFEEFVGDHKLKQGKTKISSADFEQPETDGIGDVEKEKKHRAQYTLADLTDHEMEPGDDEIGEDEEPAPEPVPELPVEPEEIVTPEEPLDTETVVPNPLESTEPVPEVQPAGNYEEYLAGVRNFEDWSIFKQALNKDSITKHLIEENTEYVGLINMLDVLDKKIEAVWRDPALTADMKFEKIKAIGLERSVVRASTNSMNVEKAISIITTIVLSAKRTVEEKVASIDASMYKISTDKAEIMDTSYIDRAIQERMDIQLQLLNLARGIIDLYRSIDRLVDDEIKELDRKLPSANEFINQMVKPIGTEIFTPQNTASLCNKLAKALQQNYILASQMEESVNAVIEMLFALCEKDEEIIHYQQSKINLLKAHRVEDVIIVNSLLKNCLRLWTGADNTGRSSTAITYAGILSRRQNSLLIDLTGKSKFREYGITPMHLDDFMTSRPEQQFLCVEADVQPTAEELQDIIQQVKSRLNYYPYVNIIVPPENTDMIDQLSADAKTINYITNCTTESIKVMKDCIEKHKSANIARRLITIDAPVSPLTIADSVGCDPTQVQIITLPSVPAIRACSLRHDRPYEYEDTVRIYEEAIR